MRTISKEIEQEIEFIAKMTQFRDLIPSLQHERVGEKAKSKSVESNDGVEYVFQQFKNEKEISYDTIRGISDETLRDFFDRLYKKQLKDFPELELPEFYGKEKGYFKAIKKDALFGDYKSLTTKILRFIDEALKKKVNEVPNDSHNFLIDLFEHESKYTHLMNVLSEMQLIEPNTHKWTSTKTGYKGLICAYIKEFYAKGYFKKSVILNDKLCSLVSRNTFGVEIKSNKTYYDAMMPDVEKNQIPYASELL